MSDARVFEVPLKCPSSTLLSDSSWLFSSTYGDGGPRTVVLDLLEWPPRLAAHEVDELTLSAAVDPRGELLMFASPNANIPRKWLLRRYARATDPKPAHEEPAPFAVPDLSAMLASMNETDRYIESAQTHAVDALSFVGDRALLIPRHLGISSFHPWILTRGKWSELSELPRFVKSVDDAGGRPAAHSLTLGDGADVLVWNRQGFEWDGKHFVRSFEHEIPLGWTDSSPLVPSGSSGFFCVASGALLEVTRGSQPPRRHLEGMYVAAMQRGPDGTLLLELSPDGWALYDPGGDTLTDLSKLTDDARDVMWSRGGYLIVARGTFGSELHRVSRAEMDSAVKSKVSLVVAAAEKAKLRTDADALDSDRARSRPRLAADGERVFTLFQGSLQQHDYDVPRPRIQLESHAIGVAVSPTRAACLDSTGVLRLVDLATSSVLCREQVVERPRTIVGSGATLFAVVGVEWTTLVGDQVYTEDSRTPHLERRSVAFDRGLAGCFTADRARLVLTGEGRRAVTVDPTNGEVVALPAPEETIHALASVGPERCIALGLTGLHSLDLRERRWSRLEGKIFVTPGDHLAVSPNGQLLAVESTDRQVEVLRLSDLESVISVGYPDSFQTGGELEVVGLAFLDDNRLAIGLSGGNANIVEIAEKTAGRTDAPAGEQNARWVFILNGSILIAE